MTAAIGLSAETVEEADALAVVVLSLVDPKATGERAVVEIMAEAIERADTYRRLRARDAG